MHVACDPSRDGNPSPTFVDLDLAVPPRHPTRPSLTSDFGFSQGRQPPELPPRRLRCRSSRPSGGVVGLGKMPGQPRAVATGSFHPDPDQPARRFHPGDQPAIPAFIRIIVGLYTMALRSAVRCCVHAPPSTSGCPRSPHLSLVLVPRSCRRYGGGVRGRFLSSRGFRGPRLRFGHLAAFLLLQSRQSIWQLSSVVLPPSDHGLMWSASILLMANGFLQIEHVRSCFS